MVKNNITRSPLVAGFMAVAMSFQSPAGHDAIYQIALQGWFAPQWIGAMRQTGTFMSFEAFKQNAMIEIWMYDPNPDVFVNNMRLLNTTVSLCIPITGDDKDNQNVPQNNFACHVAATRKEKNKKGVVLV